MKTEDLLFTDPFLTDIENNLYGHVKTLFKNCFYSTLLRSAELATGEEPFVFTGDIYAMWLRDSAAQVWNYMRFLNGNPGLKQFVEGVIRRQIRYVLTDPYANAFNKTANDKHCWPDITEMHPLVWERKYEVDSLCYVIRLVNAYIEETGELPRYTEQENPGENRDAQADNSVGMLVRLFKTIIDVWETEQHHFGNSAYRFTRENTWERDTIHNGGMGNPVNTTGMTWSGFRPSDDACIFGYHIPSNFFAAQSLMAVEKIAAERLGAYDVVAKAKKLRTEILRGISNYGTYLHPVHGRIYAYETDGFGNHILMDDANAPSLLSVKYLSPDVIDEDIYIKTRRFVLSKDNPTYYEGKFGKGVGSIHTPKGNIWPIALVIQGLTSTDKAEIMQVYKTLTSTDAGTGYMHESIDTQNPSNYTRAWFSWADTMFCELVMKIYKDDDLKDILLH